MQRLTQQQLATLIVLTLLWGFNWPLMKLALQEVQRYTFRAPGQATSYFVGYNRILEIRAEAVECATNDRLTRGLPEADQLHRRGGETGNRLKGERAGGEGDRQGSKLDRGHDEVVAHRAGGGVTFDQGRRR